MLPRAELQETVAEAPVLPSRMWRWQRLGWAMIGLVTVMALTGLTGAGGPWSSASAVMSADRIDLPRITRWDADDELRVVIASGSGATEIAFLAANSRDPAIPGLSCPNPMRAGPRGILSITPATANLICPPLALLK